MKNNLTKQVPHSFRSIILVLALFLTAPFAFSKSLENVDRAGVGIKGYDPVAYFTDNAPILGSSQFQSTFDGVIPPLFRSWTEDYCCNTTLASGRPLTRIRQET